MEQAERLNDAGLHTEARAKVTEAVATGSSVPPELAEDVDGTDSFDQRVDAAVDTTLDWLLPALVVAIFGGVLAIVVLRLDRRRKITYAFAGAEDDKAFSPAVRTRLMTLSPWTLGPDATVRSALVDAPKPSELHDNLKLFDWFFKRFWGANDRVIRPSLVPKGSDTIGVALELERRNGEPLDRVLLYPTPRRDPTVKDDGAASMRLVGPAAAWMLATTNVDGELPSSEVGTASWEAFAAHLSGLDHTANGRRVQAISAYSLALEKDPGFEEARNNLGALLSVQANDAAIFALVIQWLDDIHELAVAP
jgi:hypothetical protein